jgi:hypothetical protein
MLPNPEEFYALWANKMLYFIFPSAKVQGIFIQTWVIIKVLSYLPE